MGDVQNKIKIVRSNILMNVLVESESVALNMHHFFFIHRISSFLDMIHAKGRK